MSNRRPNASRAFASGQTLVEFMVVVPILMLLIFSILQDYVLQEREQKANMSLWYLLRGSTYDYVHSGPDTEDLKKDTANTFFHPGDTVYITVGEKGQLPEIALDAAFTGLSTLVLDTSLVRSANVKVSFPNPFPSVEIPFATGPFGRLLLRGKTLSARADGWIWTSWTSILNAPDFDGKRVNDITADPSGGAADGKKKMEEQMKGQIAKRDQAEKDRLKAQQEADEWARKEAQTDDPKLKTQYENNRQTAQQKADGDKTTRDDAESVYQQLYSSCVSLYQTCWTGTELLGSANP